VAVVSPSHAGAGGFGVPDAAGLVRLSEQGKTVVVVIVDGAVSGVLALADVIRPESADAVARLKEMGVAPLMLTGDSEEVAAWVAAELGIERYFAEVLPDEKAAKVREVQATGKVVAMTGDGVNDAPALAQADVGIAVGAGTDVAIETADVVLVRSDPQDVVNAVALSKATYRKMQQNLAWATGYNVVAIPLAAGVLFSYGIVPDTCTGCGACRKACPADAVSGSKKEPHVINQSECISCGACYEACPVSAVAKVEPIGASDV
jgi:Cu2+-exporting ATPase